MDETSAALLRKAHESIGAARLLTEGGFPAAATSRAYYAMFYAAEALLQNLGKRFASHGAVISAYGREFAATKLMDSKFHRYLLNAYQRRQQADYDALAEIASEEATEQICRAEEFLNVVESRLGGQSLPPDSEGK